MDSHNAFFIGFIPSIKFIFRIFAIVLSLADVESRRDLAGSAGHWLLSTKAGLDHQELDPSAGQF